MSILDSLLGQVSGDATVQNLASKVGLSPEQVEQSVTALGQAHGQDGDTVATAAENTGLPQDKLNEIVRHLGDENPLFQDSSLPSHNSGASGHRRRPSKCLLS